MNDDSSQFNTLHNHDGINSQKVAYKNILGTPVIPTPTVLIVSDGMTTVTPVTEIDFTGATVVDGGGGIAQVAISGGGGSPGGNVNDVQVNDGAGGFTGDDSFTYSGGVVGFDTLTTNAVVFNAPSVLTLIPNSVLFMFFSNPGMNIKVIDSTGGTFNGPPLSIIAGASGPSASAPGGDCDIIGGKGDSRTSNGASVVAGGGGNLVPLYGGSVGLFPGSGTTDKGYVTVQGGSFTLLDSASALTPANLHTAGVFDRTIVMTNVASAPTGNLTNSGILYVESGALKYRGSSGTITTIAPA